MSAFAGVALLSLSLSLAASDDPPVPLVASFAPSFADAEDDRLSVLYHPDPLKTIAGVVMSRRGRFPQFGHAASFSSANDWTELKTCPQ